MALIDYQRAAPNYDAARAVPLDALDGWRQAVAPYVEGASPRPVLDVGCGTGIFAHAFAEWFGVQVVGVEPSEAMLTEARLKRSHRLITYLQGDAEHLPVESGTCAVAWLSTVIHHLPDLPAAAIALRRALIPGGVVLIRSAFPGRTDGITLFRFFPEARRVVDSFPSVDATVQAFVGAGFEPGPLTSVPQVSGPHLGALLLAAQKRADTTLLGISDDTFAEGIRRLERAIAEEARPEPVVDHLDLLVFRLP